MRFSLAEIASQPWKNGGGSTRELALQQEAGKMTWRVSLAQIDQDGAFSAFPGLARIHCIVSGAGLSLFNADTHLEARPLQPLHFAGGLLLDARLNDGPCQAFNLIYDPARISADMQILGAGEHMLGAGDYVIFVLSGQANLAGQDHPFAAGEGCLVGAGQTLGISVGSQVVSLALKSQ